MSEKQLEGSFGAAPADAPHEVAQPLTQGAMDDALARAARNEIPLAPFNPQPMTVAPPPRPAPVMSESAQRLHQAAQRQAPATHQPAASEGDSPSRGIPQPILDPGKRITGGFGHPDTQYFELDGSEVMELVLAQFDELAARIKNDLRFRMAITYPRVRVRTQIIVEGHVDDANGDFTIPAIPREALKTPLEVAQARAKEIIFVVVADHREVDEDGASVTPPDRVREELGLTKPRKQQIQTPGGKMFVDKPVEGIDGLF